MRNELTTQQTRVLDAIRTAIAETGLPPTVRELGARVGLHSPCTVHRHLEALERHGAIKRIPNRSRNIRLVVPEDDLTLLRRRVQELTAENMALRQPERAAR